MTNLISALKANKKQFTLVLAATVVVIGVDMVLFLPRQWKGAQKVSAGVASLQEKADALRDEIASFEMRQASAEKGLEKTQQKPRRIITEEQLPLLLKEVSELANKNKITIMQIKPLAAKEEAPAKKKTSKRGKAKKKQAATSALISFDMFSTYHNLGAFINQLEDAQSLMAIEEISIKRDPTNSRRQTINLVVRAYVKK